MYPLYRTSVLLSTGFNVFLTVSLYTYILLPLLQYHKQAANPSSPNELFSIKKAPISVTFWIILIQKALKQELLLEVIF